MPPKFDYFVLFAEMRTGSNFLEESLNAMKGIKCWGEVYNPVFIGKSGRDELLGVTKAQREENPMSLLSRMREETKGVAGFRLFHDHDPRMIEACLKDRRCAKIILTRNPLESYVSHKIAQATGQWRLGDMKDAKTAKITYDGAEFQDQVQRLQDFQMHLMGSLQRSGQSAFYISYDDIGDTDVLAGIARYLGVEVEVVKTSTKTKVQNPTSLRDKVENYDEMAADLAGIDRFNLTRTPNFEPRRGPAVPNYIAAAKSPLLYMPIKCGPEESVTKWLADLDGVADDALLRGFNQKTLRQWKRQNPGNRGFSVIRHPVARLYLAFVRHILVLGPECLTEIREILRDRYKLPLPAGAHDAPGAGYGVDQHRAAFLGFAEFVKGNLGGQTGVRVAGAWASQSEFLLGMGQVMLPDMVIREEEMARDLTHLASGLGVVAPDLDMTNEADAICAIKLGDIYDEAIEAAVKAAYQRDYMMFGFRAWRA